MEKIIWELIYEIFKYSNLKTIYRFLLTSKTIYDMSMQNDLIYNHIIQKKCDQWILSNSSLEIAFFTSIRNMHYQYFRRILDSGFDPSISNNEAIVTACEKGSLLFIEDLLEYPQVDPSVRSNICLIISIEKTHVDVVKRLLQDQRVNPNDRNCAAEQIALYMSQNISGTQPIHYFLREKSIKAKEIVKVLKRKRLEKN